MQNDPVETKLSAARTKLILDKPFLGALVLRLPMLDADPEWCHTVATDARGFYYNYDYINGLSLAQTQFALAHEAMHCALSHFARRQHRDKARWDLACDLAINPLLIAEGLTPVPEAIFLSEFEGMTAEEIYPCLDENEELKPHDDHVYDSDKSEGGQRGSGNRTDEARNKGAGGGPGADDNDGGKGEQPPDERESPSEGQGIEDPDDGPGEQPPEIGGEGGKADQPPPLTPEEAEQLSIQWKQRMAGAAQQAMQAGKMSQLMQRIIDHLLQPDLPWRNLLARYLNSTARDDFNYARPSRRDGDAIFPSLRSHALDVVVALDTSGSISDTEMQEFVSEVNAIKGAARATVTLHACDSRLVEGGPWRYEPWEEFSVPPKIGGGGTTDFRPLFEWIEREGLRPDLVIYFTDAAGQFPEREPAVPVLWLVKGKAKVPWGTRIQLN